MANILEDIQKKLDAGFDAVDESGKLVKLTAIKKEAYKAYNKEVLGGNIDPLEYDFKRYFDWFTSANFTSLEMVYDTIEELISGEVEEIEVESTEPMNEPELLNSTEENNEEVIN